MNLRGRVRSAVTVTLVAIITCGGFSGVATAAQASPPATASAEVTAEGFKSAVNETLQYVTTDRNGNRRFDTARALSAGASPEVFVIGAEVNRISPVFSGTATPLAGAGKDGMASTQGLSAGFPVHGNWCGPGHGGGTPIDTLDTLCMRHDKCYAARGYFDCLCDKQLRDEIYRFRNRMGGLERAKAAAITVVFSSIPCRP